MFAARVDVAAGEVWVAVEDADAWLREHPDLPLPDARAWLTRARSELDALGAGSPEGAA